MSASPPIEPAPSDTALSTVAAERWSGKFLGGLRAWLHENWQATVVDVNQLSPALRRLTVFGYGVAVAYLVIILCFELIGSLLPRFAFEYGSFLNATPVSTLVSPVALFFYSLSGVIGWSFVLTGMKQCGRRIFIPVLLIFSIQYMLTSSLQEGTNVALGLIQVLVFGMVLLVSILHLVAPRFSLFRDNPLLEFGMWVGLLSLRTIGAWATAGSWQNLAKELSDGLFLLVTFAIPFWFILAIDAVSLAKEYGYFVSQKIQRIAPLPLLQWITPLLTLVPVLLIWVAPSFEAPAAVCFSPILFVVVLGITITQRRNRRTTSTLFWMVVSSLVYTVFLGLAGSGSDVNELVLGATGLIPSAVLFALLLLYDIASFGTRAAANDSKVLPRSGRLLLYLGTIVLAAGFALFIFNIRDVTTNEPVGGAANALNLLTLGTMSLVGPLYFLWSFWKERTTQNEATPHPLESAVAGEM